MEIRYVTSEECEARKKEILAELDMTEWDMLEAYWYNWLDATGMNLAEEYQRMQWMLQQPISLCCEECHMDAIRRWEEDQQKNNAES